MAGAQSGPAAGQDFPSAQLVRHSRQRDVVQFEETDLPRNLGSVPGSQRKFQASCFRLLDSFFHIARTNSRRGSQDGLPDGKHLLLQSDSLFQLEIYFDGRNDLDRLASLVDCGLVFPLSDRLDCRLGQARVRGPNGFYFDDGSITSDDEQDSRCEFRAL